MMDRLYHQGCPFDERVIPAAVAQMIDDEEWLHDTSAPVFWLRERGAPWGNAAYIASKSGNWTLMKSLVEAGASCDYFSSLVIASSGDLGLLKWALRHGCLLRTQMVVIAARCGHRHVLRFLMERFVTQPLEFDESEMFPAEVAAGAARGGHFNLLIWLVKTLGAQLDYLTVVSACEAERKDIVSWCIDQGVELTIETSVAACQTGRLDLVEMVIGAGAPYKDARVFSAASESGSGEVIEWAMGANIPTKMLIKDGSRFGMSAHQKTLSAMKWLRERVKTPGFFESRRKIPNEK